MESFNLPYSDIMDMPWSRRRRFIQDKADLETRRNDAQKAAMKR